MKKPVDSTAESPYRITRRPFSSADQHGSWYFTFSLVGSLLIGQALWTPWRIADADVTFGKRFKERKVYALLYSGKKSEPLMWPELSKLTCNKFTDMETGSRYSDIAQTIVARLPDIRREKGYQNIGGAYFGCPHWDKCKEHMGQRCVSYYVLRWVGTGSFYLLIFSLCCVACGLFLQAYEYHSSVVDVRQVMQLQYFVWVCAMFAAVQAVVATLTWIQVSERYLRSLQATAYYPFPDLQWGAAYVLAGDCLLLIAAALARLRCTRSQADFLSCYTERGHDNDDTIIPGANTFPDLQAPGDGVFGAGPPPLPAVPPQPGQNPSQPIGYGGAYGEPIYGGVYDRPPPGRY